MNGFIACDIVCCNTVQLLEADKKLIYIIHLKGFLFNLDNGLLSKYMYVCMCMYACIF
jgi:hypothetical protein